MIFFSILLSLAQIASQIDGTVGVAVINIETGRSISVRGDERFPMGSVFKFPTALEVLHQVDRGRLDLDRNITIEPKDFSLGWSPLRDAAKGRPLTISHRELLVAMLRDSDNTAADVYLGILGAKSVTSDSEISV